MRNIKLLMHTHWDREWYFTKDETQVLLVSHMKETIEFLETNPDVIYILDGQSVMIDDFLAFAPKWETRLRKLVENNQLRVGPWYTQTDLLIVHGESIIRNLYYGIKRAKQFGEPMLVGYAPDTFGHNAQMPQIYKQAGIKSTFFWRGFSELKSQKADFIWEGVDQSQIFGINLATGYQGAKYLESTYEQLANRMQKLMKVLDKYSISNTRLIMNGHDQMPIQKNIKHVKKLIEKIYPNDQVRISDFESYVDDVAMHKDQLTVVKGELNDSKHARIHRTINSTRMDIKHLNSKIETQIVNVLEPLCVIASQYGFEYPHEQIDYVFKQLFGVHAHDSIGGCNSDKVNQDIKQRLLQVSETVETQIELLLRQIGLAIQTNTKENIIIVNPMPNYRENNIVDLEVQTISPDFKIFDQNQKSLDYTIISQKQIDAGIIDRQVAARLLDTKIYISHLKVKVENINGLALQTLKLVEQETKLNNKLAQTNTTQIENAYYVVKIENSSIELIEKATNTKVAPLFSIENSGDAGDSYDYSPPHNDAIINYGVISNVEVLKNNMLELLTFEISYNVPKDQNEREQNIKSIKQTFKVQITLLANTKHIELNLQTVNQVKDSRYRLVVNQIEATNQVETDMQLSTITRSVFNAEPLKVWKNEKWAEKPVSIETFQTYVARKTNNLTCVVINNQNKEYEVLDKNTYITLYRTFSHLGKRNLINRPGRPSGIEIETIDNQLLNEQFEFKFALIYASDLNTSLASYAKNWLTPCIGYAVKQYNRFNINVPTQQIKQIENHYLNINWNNLTISATKLTEDTNNIFIRYFNPTKQNITIKFENINYDVYEANLLEKCQQLIEQIIVKPQQIGQIILKNKKGVK